MSAEVSESKESSANQKPARNEAKKPTRYIPKAIQHKVRTRDQQQCTFCSPTGRKCTETRALQIDHIKPFAYGGNNEESNLRLLCPAHNRLRAEQIFGKQKIESYTKHFSRGSDL